MRMSFYTLNSKLARRFWGALLLVVLAQAAFSIAFRKVVERYTTADRYMENKESRFLHLEKRAVYSLDFIFVGSSFTKNHISTKIFSDHGFRIYNFGIPGRHLGDLPSMVEKAASKQPKGMVICVEVTDFFQPIESTFPDISDIQAYWKTGQPWSVVVPSLWNYLLNRNALHYYREAIYNQLVAGLQRLDFHPVGHAISATSMGVSQPQYSAAQNRQLKEVPDCEVFKSTDYGGSVMRLVNCTNGDGIEYGAIGAANSSSGPAQVKLFHHNERTIQLLNYVLGNLKKRGIRPFLVLKPLRGKSIEYNAAQLKNKIEAPILDYTQNSYPEEDWGDEDHLNVFGRKKFSESLAVSLQELNSANL